MKFKNMKSLIAKVNEALGEEFINEFRNKRKELARKEKLTANEILFKYEDNTREWAINSGGGVEVAYHIHIDKEDLLYGLGFNTYYVPFSNDARAVEKMKPYMDGFLQNKKIKKILEDYDFVDGNIDQLINPKDGEYTLFGKSVKVSKMQGGYSVKDSIFNKIISDLKKQFEAYKIIFEYRNKVLGEGKMENIEKPVQSE